MENCDYAVYQSTNEIFSTGRPYGLFPEWYRGSSIQKLLAKTDDSVHRQMPGSFFLDRQNDYRVAAIHLPPGLDKVEEMKFTFDEEDDWDSILELHNALNLEVLDSTKVGNLLDGLGNQPEKPL